LRRIEREAEALKRVDPAAAFTVLGAVACLRKDYASMRDLHTRAIDLGGGAFAMFQYSVSLFKADFWGEALALAEAGHADDALNVLCIEKMIGCALTLGLKSRARAYAQKWRKLRPSEEPFVTDEEIETFESGVRPSVEALASELLIEYRDLWESLSKR
jgi:hypothetical protein